MKYKKSRWETEYDNFKSINKDTLVKKMESIRREMAGLKEGKEYGAKKTELDDMKKELAKYERTEKNSSKIENVLDFKKNLVESAYKLLEQKNKFAEISKRKKSFELAMTKLDDMRKENFDKFKMVEQKLKSASLKAEDRAKLEEQKQTYLRNIKENDEKYSKIAMANDEGDKYLSSYDEKQINDSLQKNEQLINKCDLIGANLVRGKSMEDIKASLSKFTFKPSEKFEEKIQNMRSMYAKDMESEKSSETIKKDRKLGKEGDDSFAKIVQADVAKNVSEVMEAEKKNNRVIPSDIDLTVDELDELDELDESKKTEKASEKPSRFAAIKNMFKKLFNNTIGKLINRKGKLPAAETVDLEAEDSEKTAKKIEKSSKKGETTKRKEIDDYEYAMKHLDGKDDDKVLSEIAEKGVSGFREDIKVDLNKKYKDMKDAAAIDYAIRYKGKYKEQDGINEDERE